MTGHFALMSWQVFRIPMWDASRDPRDQSHEMPPSPLVSLRRSAQTQENSDTAKMLLDTVLDHIGNTPLVRLLANCCSCIARRVLRGRPGMAEWLRLRTHDTLRRSGPTGWQRSTASDAIYVRAAYAGVLPCSP